MVIGAMPGGMSPCCRATSAQTGGCGTTPSATASRASRTAQRSNGSGTSVMIAARMSVAAVRVRQSSRAATMAASIAAAVCSAGVSLELDPVRW